MNQRAALLLLALVAAAAGPVAWAQAKPGEWTPKRFPNPVTDPQACGRDGVHHSWVCDPDQVMSVESRNVVEGIVKGISQGEPPYAKAPCGEAGEVGAQVAVAVMQSFSPQLVWGKEPERVAMEFAEGLHNTWGVGRKECHNGVLLLLSISDRQIYISRGKGVARKLTDRVLDRIIDGMKPALRAGRVGPAVEAAVVDIGLALAVEHTPEETESWLSKYGLFSGILGGFAAIAGWAGWQGRKQQHTYNKCKAQLEKLKRDQARLQAGGTFNPTSCPICLEDFDLTGRGSHVNGHDVPATNKDDTDPEVDGQLPTNNSETEPLLNKLKDRIRRLSAGGEGAGPSSSAGGGGTGVEGVAKGKAAGAGSAGSGSSGARGTGHSDAAAPKRKPLVLPCKHQFCEQCISEWVNQKKTRCPVCRKSIADNDDQGGDEGSTSRPRPPCSDGVEADDGMTGSAEHLRRAYRGPYQGYSDPRYRQRGYTAQDMLRDELLFRLLVLRRRYPAYIDDGMVRQWSDDVAHGHELSMNAWQSFQQSDPAVRAAMAQSGSRGASGGFGGGSSGGGRGGSW